MVAAVGIDLGTANTRVAVYRNDRFEVIPHEGHNVMPSFVAFTETRRLVGQAAKNQANSNPKNTVFNILRLLGADYHAPSMQEWLKLLPFEVLPAGTSADGTRQVTIKVKYKGHESIFSPTEILAMLLKRAKRDAEEYLGQPILHAVITIPCCFDLIQRYAVKDAAAIAGINALRLIHSPTVALADLHFSRNMPGERNVLICDIGAGHTQFVVATCEEGLQDIRAISAYTDRTMYTGLLHEENLMGHVARLFQEEHGVLHQFGLHDNSSRALRRLRTASEKAKHEFHSTRETLIDIENYHDGKDLRVRIHHKLFIELIINAIRRIQVSIEAVLGQAQLEKRNIHDIVLIGGASRVVAIQQAISDFFKKEPLRCLNLEETSARGAAFHAALLSGDTSCKTLSDLLLCDVTSKPLGIQTAGGVMTPIVKQNCTIPTVRYDVYEIVQDDQDMCLARCFEGHHKRTQDCVRLGHAKIAIPPARQKTQQVEVSFDIDANYNIVVTLLEKETGKSERVKLNGYNDNGFARISKTQLEGMVTAENQMELEDTLEQHRMVARQYLEETLYRIKDWTDSLAGNIRAEGVNRLESLADSMLSWVDSNPLARAAEYDLRAVQVWELVRSVGNEQALHYSASPDRPRREGSPILAPMVPSASSISSREKQGQHTVHSKAETLGTAGKIGESKGVGPAPKPDTISDIGRGMRSDNIPTMHPPLSIVPSPSITSEQSDTPARAEVGLVSIFERSHSSSTYSDSDFGLIASYLRNTGQPDWSKVPRLYTVLRTINELDTLHIFIQQGITDIWFPFSQATLPRVLSPSTKADFLKHQDSVLSKSLLFEKSSGRRHARFSHGEPLPYEVVGKLGAGAHGQVDKVISLTSHRVYARKLFQRVRGMRKDAVHSFLTELQVLKRVQNHHCVELIQSYTDPKYFALIMSPVGDCNLLDYYSLALKDADKISLLRSFFGCLANALQYIHSIRIRHRDIKPHNILVKGDRVYLTDFGIALDWEELSGSTTTADSGKTMIYAAPEVVRYEKRNTSADIWSLGCVFMEMATVLKGVPVTEMRRFFEDSSGNYRFYANTAHLIPWIDSCRPRGSLKDDVIFDWVMLMLEEDPTKRPTAASLHHDINVESSRQGVLFCGGCCHESGGSSGVEDDSEDDAWDIDGDEATVMPGQIPEST